MKYIFKKITQFVELKITRICPRFINTEEMFEPFYVSELNNLNH
jgi:hypothetical protein